MSKKPKDVFIALCDNRIICYHVKLEPFYKELKTIEPDINSLSYYQKEFKKNNEIGYMNVKDRKTYYLIRLSSQ
ncbi:hypothetical protein MBM09_00745 [Flaviramulus sp. BrNp1-15]|uniref:hypothetical protein n=1 Tax=Flaviramulus sp. BrNp1-15 TaxID=2916754 RepID=UPI001EE8AD52|nr:hypothetical protein [Flaviramulus sp. BrNp1-15]ULC59521.1 hypothetical protein MBM09_00745 [Flaviramulus sp. BrNp1-15]